MRSIVIIAIFCICFFQDVFCQNPPETIDIGKDFAKIERYNEYIYNANKNHYAAGKGRWNNFFKYTLGIGAMGGGAYLIYDGAQNDQVWTYPVGGGLIGFGFTYTIFNTSSVKWYKNYERDYIASARGLFGYIKGSPGRKNTGTTRSRLNYAMGAYSTNNSYGIEFGKLNGSRFGTYFSIKANSEMIDALNSYDEDITIATSDDLPENYSLGITSLSFGITKSLVYPVYLYLGGGVSYYNYYQVNDENYRTSYTLETQDEFIPFPEGGIALKLGKIAIKAGSQYVKEEFFSQVGLGIGL